MGFVDSRRMSRLGKTSRGWVLDTVQLTSVVAGSLPGHVSSKGKGIPGKQEISDSVLYRGIVDHPMMICAIGTPDSLEGESSTSAKRGGGCITSSLGKSKMPMKTVLIFFRA